MRNVVQPAPHEALDRGDGVARIIGLRCLRVKADLALLPRQVAHHAGQDHALLLIRQAFGYAVAHSGHQRMGGAQVYADGYASLVRVRRLTGF